MGMLASYIFIVKIYSITAPRTAFTASSKPAGLTARLKYEISSNVHFTNQLKQKKHQHARWRPSPAPAPRSSTSTPAPDPSMHIGSGFIQVSNESRSSRSIQKQQMNQSIYTNTYLYKKAWVHPYKQATSPSEAERLPPRALHPSHQGPSPAPGRCHQELHERTGAETGARESDNRAMHGEGEREHQNWE